MNLWPSRAPPSPAPPTPALEPPQQSTQPDTTRINHMRPTPTTDAEPREMGLQDSGPSRGTPSPAPSCPLPRRPPLSRGSIPPPAPTPPSQPPPATPGGPDFMSWDQLPIQSSQSQLQAQSPQAPAGAGRGSVPSRDQLPPAAPAPPQPPSQSQSQPPQTQDSLSLAQLRRIVTQFPRSPPDSVTYDFSYSDQSTHEDEIDEWFVYQYWQWVRLNAAQRAFQWIWDHEFQAGSTWDQADPKTRESFITNALDGLSSPVSTVRRAHMGQLMYLVLGRWGDTAGGVPVETSDSKRTAATRSQLQAMKEGVQLLASVGGIPRVWKSLIEAFEPFWSDEATQAQQPGGLQEAQDELMNLLTVMYMAIQETLNDPKEMAPVAEILRELNPSLVLFMLTATSKLRWDDQGSMPQTQVLLLLWKSILLIFGGTQEMSDTKKAIQETENESKLQDTITASPLDYHVFRQEITSKYPAYIPPQPKLPLAAEQTSILPQLQNHAGRNNASDGIASTPANPRNTGGASILHQPVHIATPAPSPPPSPGVGGKGGKKQNYQTNQSFPFMYPPLDATSNSAGGKGIPDEVAKMIARRWEGSDIPASILEAGELFYTRTRMTRATRQLWQEREKFLQFERGWAADSDDDDDVEELDLDLLTLEERELIGRPPKDPNKKKEEKIPDIEVDFGPNPMKDETVRQRLVGLEDFYREGLPHFQSLVIVIHKTILAIVTSFLNSPAHNRNQDMNNLLSVQQPPQQPQQPASPPPEPTLGELDATRTREISGKAATGIVVLLLKWMKISHILKFEYLTQLLLDANFVPLFLKFIAHQDVQVMVDTKNDRPENSFFHFCNLRARSTERPVPEPEDVSSEDDACPPPIRRRPRSPARPEAPEEAEKDGNEEAVEDAKEGSTPVEGGAVAERPEVDEMGYAVNPTSKEPITDFSWRNFFTLINFLRILQKICKNKVHRNMLLVQYKSSNILRKALKIPQPELRLYTLKLFKNQVPYCGRKWRQSNMRVITAVYLHCRPELRDEWLAGSDVDAEIEEAVPLEQALRSLTHFFNRRRYADMIGLKGELREEVERREEEWGGFFGRELEKMEWSWGDDE